MAETRENRLKKIRMRSWRRGTKEMDLILGRFADSHLDSLNAEMLSAYESLLGENDQDLYAWFCGRSNAPDEHGKILDCIRVSYASAHST